jgi:pyrroline-5-carboxylate reductase
MTNLTFLGGGAMGEAIIKALTSSGAFRPDHIRVSEPDAARRDGLRERYGVQPAESNAAAVRGADIVVVAVKPQVVGQVLAEIKPALDASALIFSIAAGVTIEAFRSGLHPTQPVLRSIPNTPAQIGQGMTAWIATDNVSDAQLVASRAILSAMGEDVRVDKEAQIDMATAINGSGPAYIFLMLEALIDAGVQMGFMRPVAEKLVMQTFKGSVLYAQQSGQHPAVLKNQVTSAGGTTAAGLYALEHGGLRTTLADAVFAAYRRSLELGAK